MHGAIKGMHGAVKGRGCKAPHLALRQVRCQLGGF